MAEVTIRDAKALQTPKKPLIFVDTSGIERAPNTSLRRSHVMQNYMRNRGANSNSSLGGFLGKGRLPAAKMTFRLSAQGLERRHAKKKVHVATSKGRTAVFSAFSLPGLENVQEQNLKSKEKLIRSEVASLTPGEIQALLRLSASTVLVFGSGKADPFGILPMKLTLWDEDLVKRFSVYEKWPWCPVSGQSMWAPFAFSDPLVFSVTIYTWSMGFYNRLGGDAADEWLQRNPEVLQHKVAAISFINERLSHPTEVVSDSTIAAVAAMTNLELILGCRETAIQHVNGLTAIIAVRGGLETFQSDLQSLIKRLICWTDIVYSELFGMPLRYPPSELWDSAWTSYTEVSLPGSLVGLSPGRSTGDASDDHKLLEILHTVHGLCAEESKQPLKTLVDDQRMKRCDMFQSIEYRLRLILLSESPTTSQGVDSSVWTAVALATLVFVHHFLRGGPLWHRQYDNLLIELQISLSHLGKRFQKLRFSQSLLLWMIGVGTVCSVGRACNSWFVESLSETCESYVMDWPELRSLLGNFLWTGSGDEERYHAAWQLVLAFRKHAMISNLAY